MLAALPALSQRLNLGAGSRTVLFGGIFFAQGTLRLSSATPARWVSKASSRSGSARVTGIQRGDRRRFPYEPRVVGGKLLMPAELQLIHRYVVETPEAVTDEIRAVVETVWPELISKLPPKL